MKTPPDVPVEQNIVQTLVSDRHLSGPSNFHDSSIPRRTRDDRSASTPAAAKSRHPGNLQGGATPMRVLSIRPPWAQAIIAGEKDVENRSWSTTYRGPVAVHASLRFDTGAWDHAPLLGWMEHYWGMTRDTFTGEAFRGGAIIGVVELVGVHTDLVGGRAATLCSPWADDGAHHLVLANPRPIVEPIPFKGALGLRRLDDATTAAVLGAIA